MQQTSVGVILDDTSTSLQQAQQVLVNTFGNQVNLDPTSPNGVLITNIAEQIQENNTKINNVEYALNPSLASGTQLDALCSNLGLSRQSGTYAVVVCQCGGLTNTVIPAGSQVQSTQGAIFKLQSDITIDGTGFANGVFQAVQSGSSVGVASNTVNIIISNVAGWDNVNNSTSGTAGQDIESDSTLRARFFISKASNSTNNYNAILATVQAVKNLQYANIYMNSTDSSVTIPNTAVTAPPRSVTVFTYGGLDIDIATAIFNSSAGTVTNGSTSVNVPIPNTYLPTQYQNINFQKATNVGFIVNVVLFKGAPYSPTIQNDIATIINQNFSYRTGQSVLASTFISFLNKNGVQPIEALNFSCPNATPPINNVNTLYLPADQVIVTPILANQVNITYYG